MKINKINNSQQTFGLKVRVNPELACHFSRFRNKKEAFLKQIKRLEKKGNDDDVVTLSLRTIEKDNDYNDYIVMDVFEKRGNKIFKNEDTLEILIMVEGSGIKHKKYSLNKIYKDAKASMVELNPAFSSLMTYL